MGKGDPVTTPWVFETVDYQQHAIRIQIDFDNTTRVIMGGSLFRDIGCVYDTVFLGLGPDDTPNTSPFQWAVPEGSSGLDATELATMGLNVIEDFLSMQITAGAA